MPRRLGAVFGLVLMSLGWPAVAQPEQRVLVHQTQALGRYGLFIQARQDGDCLVRRFVVLASDGRRLGTTGPLLGGQAMIMPLGHAADLAGSDLTIRTLGCGSLPMTLRVVRMAKASPDLGNSIAVTRSGINDLLPLIAPASLTRGIDVGRP